MVASRAKLTKNYVITFDVKPTGTVPGWSNLLRVFNVDANCCKIGQRIPAIFFRSRTSKLHICNAINENGNSCFDVPAALPMDKYSTVNTEATILSTSIYFLPLKTSQ